MTHKKLAFAAALTASVLLGGLSPASAATFNNGAHLRAEINQLDRRIDIAQARHRIGGREAARLSQQVRALRQDWRAFSRGGFTYAETGVLDRKIERVRARLIRQQAPARVRHAHRYR